MWWVFAIAVIVLFFVIKNYVWDKPHEEIEILKEKIVQMESDQRACIAEQRKKDQQVIDELERTLEQNKLETDLRLKERREITKQKLAELKTRLEELQQRLDDSVFVSEIAKSNLRSIPYMAAIMADFETYGLEKLARKLDWGDSQERLKKVKSIREIRKDAQEMVEKNKEAQYQLAYLFQLYPSLQEVIDCEFSQLPIVNIDELSEYDHCHDFLSKDEYQLLSISERNQLALDRYVESHNKSKWQIGRDYELFIGYKYEQKGYYVEYTGSLLKLEDLGRDLIVHDGKKTLIVQCKYWSKEKQIHENHVNQLYGTTICYCLEHNIDPSTVTGVLVTNTQLSDTAKKFADFLGIKYQENCPLENYPRIKCNIGRDEFGFSTKIYHLPFDQQYDSAVIDKPGEFMAMTVAEAEAAGFRRAYKWFGA